MTFLNCLLKLCELWLVLCPASVVFIQILVWRSIKQKPPTVSPPGL